MKVWRAFTLAFWTLLMTACVSLIAVYFILAQTLLNPAAVKKWLNDSGAYGVLAEGIVPQLIGNRSAGAPPSSVVTDEMIARAAKASIKPEDVKNKAEPIVDAVYAWLDSKSPEIAFTLSTDDETKRFLQALRVEVLAKMKSLPECTDYVDPAVIEQAGCLPWYVSAETATDSIMQRIEQQDTVRDMQLTPDSFKTGQTNQLSNTLPDLVSALWVAQLVAVPVFIAIALFVILKRRVAGLIAVSTSLFAPGLTLLALGALLWLGGSTSVESLVGKSEAAAVAGPLGKAITGSLATLTMQVGSLLSGSALVLIVLGIWWRHRIRRAQQQTLKES